MSYKPSTRGTYGDSEFTSDDSWSGQSTNPYPGEETFYPQPPPQVPLAHHPSHAPSNQLPNAQYNAPRMEGFRPQNSGRISLNDYDMQSLTAEDLLFLKKCKQDFATAALLPPSIAVGTLYWYNKSKNLPHNILKYFLLGSASLSIGGIFYATRIQKRIEESQLNTPFMQKLKHQQFINRNPIRTHPMDGRANFNATESTGDLRYDPTRDYSSTSQYAEPLENDKSKDTGSPKPTTTYEELRARNRGFGR